MGFTKIMFCSYLSYKQVSRLLNFAVGNGLLDYDVSTRLYNITRRGQDFLELYTKMENLLKSEQNGVITSLVAFVVYLFYPLFPVLADFL
jgi:hypothetical protein